MLNTQMATAHFPGNLPKYPDIQELLQSLWTVIWEKRKGGSNWYRVGDHQFELFLQWYCASQRFELQKISGELPQQYRIFFGAFDTVTLCLENRMYTFSSDPNYGHFYVPGQLALSSGAACYYDRFADEPVSQFLNHPFSNWKGEKHKAWKMTDAAKNEAVAFLRLLVKNVQSHNP